MTKVEVASIELAVETEIEAATDTLVCSTYSCSYLMSWDVISSVSM